MQLLHVKEEKKYWLNKVVILLFTPFCVRDGASITFAHPVNDPRGGEYVTSY